MSATPTRHWKLPSPKASGYIRLLFFSGLEPLDCVLLATGIIAAIGAGIPFPLLGILFGQLVDNLTSSECNGSPEALLGTSAAIRQKVLLVVYVTIANFGLIYIHTGCWSLVGENLVRRLRKRYLAALLRQNLAFFDTLPAGEVASRLDADLQSIQTGTSEKVGFVISSASYFVAAYTVSFIKAPKLAGMLFSIVPAFLLMACGGGYFVEKYTSRVSEHVASATGIASAGLGNMMVVCAFNARNRLEKVFAEHLTAAQTWGLKKAFVSALQLGLLYFIAYSANALAFWQGSMEIAKAKDGGDGTSVGAIYTVIFVLVDSSFIISQVAPFLQLFATAAGAYAKLTTTMDRVSDIDGTALEKGLALASISGDIELKGVSFEYPSRPDVKALKNISMTIPAKKHTAIVGLSGSGKSTIAALIGRLYDPAVGNVFLDGHNLRDLNVRSLRRFMGVVSQDSHLFDRSILENIAHGLINSPSQQHVQLQQTLIDESLPDLVKALKDGNSMQVAISGIGDRQKRHNVERIVDLVKQAASDANALSFIENLHHGFAATVGSSGGKLSGGQRQRVVLARALIREPSILILDEATASLDSISERIIQEALERVTEGRTTISIAHRLSTIKNADKIIVMRHGRIMEEGTYTDLITKDGEFASMVKLQSLGTVSTPRLSLDSIERMKHDGTLAPGDSPSTEADGKTIEAEQEYTVQQTKISKGSTLWSFAEILAMARPFLRWILLGILGATIVGGSYSGEAVIFGQSIGGLSFCNSASEIKSSGSLYGILFFVLALIEFFANVTSTASFGRVTEKLLRKVRMILFRFLFQQDIQWHESDGRTPSSVLSYISSDANSLSGLTGTILGVIFSIVVNMISGIILAHIVAWKIAVVLLSMIPILLASGFLRLRIQAKFHKRHQKAFAHSVGLATEAVNSIKTVASFSLESEALNVYERSLRGPYEDTIRAIAYGNFWLAVAYSIGNLVYALAYWWGAKQIMSGLYNPSQFFTVLPALLFSAQSGGQLLSLAPDVSKASVAASRVLDLLKSGDQTSIYTADLDHKIDEDVEQGLTEKLVEKNPAIQSTVGMSITFSNIHFSYPSRPEKFTLQGLSLHIPAGRFVALVGESGAGKSTIISLLERFYTPITGSILLDDHDITNTTDYSFRDDIALVPQHSTLFAGSIRFNLCLGARPNSPEPSQVDLEAACKLANIHSTITALPDGYDTPCGSGPGNSSFSGGQVQRLAIARALVRKPRLLLLDESTAALDAESEAALQDALERTCRGGGVTVVAVAHRMSTIQRADGIFMIGKGRVLASGTHEELLRAESEGGCAVYREFVGGQSLDS